MTSSNLLMQYQSECLEALKSATKVSKPFEKVFMDTLKLFMAIPGKVNFLQMGRYGEFSEQTYRNNFENETFDWFAFNEHLIRKVLDGKFLAIAVDPSFLPKSGKKTPWIGRFWSGVAGEMKRGQEFFGVGVIDVDNHDCMTLSAVQTPDAKSLEEMDYNLVEWYCQNLIILKEKLQKISRLIVADAFFSKETFVNPLLKKGFHMISRFRNDAVLFYPTIQQPTRKRGHPKWYDGKVDFANLDRSRCEEVEVDTGVAVWYPNEEDMTKWQIYFSTDDSMSTKNVINCYRTRFQLEFCFRDAKHYAGLNDCQSTDLRKLEFHRNASFASINIAKAVCKELAMPFSISSCKSIIHNAYMLNRFICVSGLQPDPQVIDKLFKELVLFTARAA